MKSICYWCCKELPKDELKRCSRCLLVYYCSKKCQELSWKNGHKKNCGKHAAAHTRPEDLPPNSEEREQFEVDLAISDWIAHWRSTFQAFTIKALDLANHPKDRNSTHCMLLNIEEQKTSNRKYNRYQIIGANVVLCKELAEEFPEYQSMLVDKPANPEKLRFFILVQDGEELTRARGCSWHDGNLNFWRRPERRELSRAIAGAWQGSILLMVNHGTPELVKLALDGNRDAVEQLKDIQKEQARLEEEEERKSHAK